MKTGQYYDLLARGFFEGKEEAVEPSIDGLQFYLEAFRELSSCRPGGMDILPIPFTAVVTYCQVYGIEELDDFLYIIRDLDYVYLGLVEEENKKVSKRGSTDGGKYPNKDAAGSSRRGGQ